MRALALFPLLAVIFVAGCAAPAPPTAAPNVTTPEQPSPPTPNITTNETNNVSTKITTNVTTNGTTNVTVAKEFTIEADDNGFYPNSISVSAGDMVKITYRVRSTGVYYGGLDFRAPPYFSTSRVASSGQTTVEFTAPSSSITVSSYWPASGVKKADMTVNVK